MTTDDARKDARSLRTMPYEGVKRDRPRDLAITDVAWAVDKRIYSQKLIVRTSQS